MPIIPITSQRKDNQMEDFFKRFVETMTDLELRDLSSALWREQEERIKARVSRGEFPKPSETEMAHHRSNNLFLAIKAYRERTGCGMREAKGVLDDAREKERVQVPIA
jgi:ribosomal protein L7/L12